MLLRFSFAAIPVHQANLRGTPPGLRAASPEGGRRPARGTSEVAIL